MEARTSSPAEAAAPAAMPQKPPAAASAPPLTPGAWIALALAVFAGLTLRADALRAPFFADDWLFLDQARGRSLFATLASRDPIGNFFRPLGRQVWFWLLGHAGGESPAAFHAANLLLFALGVALVFLLAHRLAGGRAAAIAAAFLALQNAADVPVLWGSGCQDLLAVTLALAAIELHARGRTAWAAPLVLLAPLAKESVALVPFVAVAIAKRDGESWPQAFRRAWPLFAAMFAWLAIAALAALGRPAPAAGLQVSAWGLPAALLDVVRTTLGLEWSIAGGPSAILGPIPAGTLAALALAALAVAWPEGGAGRKPARPNRRARDVRRTAAARTPPPARTPSPPSAHATAQDSRGTRRALVAGLVWAVAGALPVMLVAPIWSAYFLLFSACGVALALGALLARARPPVAAASVIVLGLLSQHARGLDEFATAATPWSPQSHVNRYYLERGMTIVEHCEATLRADHPTLPAGTTVFFAGLPGFAGVQVGDGPFVRGVYRDSSLHSYFITRVSRELVGAHPCVFEFWDHASSQLVDRTHDALLWRSLAIGFLLDDRPEAAGRSLDLARDHPPIDPIAPYVLGLVAASRGDTSAARTRLQAAGCRARRGSPAEAAPVRAALAAGDTARATALAREAMRAAALDPDRHRELAELLFVSPDGVAEGVIESFAARAVDSTNALAWRNWAQVQARYNRNFEAKRSLERFYALDPAARADDREMASLLALLEQRLPGGAALARGLQGDVGGE